MTTLVTWTHTNYNGSDDMNAGDPYNAMYGTLTGAVAQVNGQLASMSATGSNGTGIIEALALQYSLMQLNTVVEATSKTMESLTNAQKTAYQAIGQ